MAQPVSCDICEAEPGAQMMTNLETGGTIAVGAACLPLFYAQSTLTLMDAGEHKGLPQRCQACRRIHERVTLAARPGQPTDDVDPGNVRDQAGPGLHDQAAADQDEAAEAALEAERTAAGGET